MSKAKKIILFSVGGIVVLLAVIAVVLRYVVDSKVYKTRVQAAASEAVGMDVRIGGRLGIGIFPDVHLTMNDVHIRNRGKEIVAAKKVRVGVEFVPLFHDKFGITSVTLIRPSISIKLDADGRYNFEATPGAGAGPPTVDLPKVDFADASFLYADKRTGQKIDAGNCNLNARHLLLAGGGGDVMKRVSFNATLRCGKIQAKDSAVTDLKLLVEAKKGVFDFKSVTMGIFGGQGSGSMRVDYSGADPLYQVRYSLKQFRIEALLKTRSPEKIAAGTMDFSMDLTMRGKTAQEMKQSAAGEVVLRGDNLTLYGHDLDKEFSRFESSQNFSLVDVGAYFFAGPAGLAVTKGYDFTALLRGAGGESSIHTFVSQWKVDKGVMHAQDVAMATNKYRMALLGGLDMANARFVDVTLALLDDKGCAVVEQKINGPFAEPEVEQPNILVALAGPVIKLFKEGGKLLSGGACKVIYTGTVASPH